MVNTIFLKRKNTREFEALSADSQKGPPMFSAKQYRAKAMEYSNLMSTANGPDEAREFQRLQRSFSELADNAQWVTDNHGNVVRAIERATAPFTPAATAQSIPQQ
jgi:hypothetical protein